MWDRQVSMLMGGKQMLLAKSTIFLTDEAWRSAAEEARVPVSCAAAEPKAFPASTLT